MKFAHVMKSVAVAAAVVAAAPGFAQTVTLDTSASNTGSFVFDSSLLGALAAGGVTVSAVAPATTIMSGTTVTGASAPVTAVNLDSGNHLTGSNPIVSSGGAKQTAVANFAGSGGFLSVTNLGLDLATGYVTADLAGGNGVQSLTHVDVFKIGASSFDGTSIAPTAAGSVAVTAGAHSIVAGTLTLNQSALDSADGNATNYFAKALGLNSLGLGLLNGVTNFGTLTVNATFKTAVPEPSTYAMLGLGLAGLAVASRRRAK